MKESVPHCRNNCAFSLSQLTRVSDNLLAGLPSRIHPRMPLLFFEERSIRLVFCKDTPKYRSPTIRDDCTTSARRSSEWRNDFTVSSK